MIDAEKVEKLLERNTIEVAPLAFMRGRTLNDSFIIMDEAQNCTPEQMKMILTRTGFNSKMVVTGDLTQVDLPSRVNVAAWRKRWMYCSGVEGISFVQFDDTDVVRHNLVRGSSRHTSATPTSGAGRHSIKLPVENGVKDAAAVPGEPPPEG